jgi:hypothetical protein
MWSQGEPQNVETGTQHRAPGGVGIKNFQHFFGFFTMQPRPPRKCLLRVGVPGSSIGPRRRRRKEEEEEEEEEEEVEMYLLQCDFSDKGRQHLAR